MNFTPRAQTSDLEVAERGNRARFKFVVGDYFTMTPDTAGTFDAAFDRGANRVNLLTLLSQLIGDFSNKVKLLTLIRGLLQDDA